MNITKEETKALRAFKSKFYSIEVYIDHYGFSEYLRMVLYYCKISQRRLGTILGYSSGGSMNRIIKGNKSMSIEKKKVLAEVLKLNKSERLALMEGK
jgi:hypothetical protein